VRNGDTSWSSANRSSGMGTNARTAPLTVEAAPVSGPPTGSPSRRSPALSSAPCLRPGPVSLRELPPRTMRAEPLHAPGHVATNCRSVGRPVATRWKRTHRLMEWGGSMVPMRIACLQSARTWTHDAAPRQPRGRRIVLLAMFLNESMSTFFCEKSMSTA
jgi:hypothetical protein